MKKFGILLMIAFGLGLYLQSCDNGKTYAEMKEEEREAIKRFIELNDIKVIDEDQFEEQDSVTRVSENEYVFFDESGVYMQIIERGKGEMLEDGRHEMLVRYVETQIAEDGTIDTISLNTMANLYAHPDVFMLTKQKNSLSASFSGNGAMSNTHYLKVGREISARSKIKLIVPHSEGTSTASQQVVPCFYEITYQLSR